jgi:hypothetical protein
MLVAGVTTAVALFNAAALAIKPKFIATKAKTEVPAIILLKFFIKKQKIK